MKLQDLSEEKEFDCEIEWEDLDYGDVCEFSDGELPFMGMKVDFCGEDIVLDLDNNKAYPDVKEYEIIKIYNNATLIYDSEDVCWS